MSKWPACRVMMASAASLLTEAIKQRAEQAVEGRGMRGAKEWGHIFLYVDPEVLAVATLAAILDRLSDGDLAAACPANTLRQRIGERIMLETHFTILKREAPRLKAVMERRIKKWDRRTIRKAMSRIEMACAETWGARTRNVIGQELLQLAVEHCGLFETLTVRYRRQPKHCVRLTEESQHTIAKMNGHLEVLTPMFRPMVSMPNDWAEGERGGYVLLSRYQTVVKASDHHPDAPAEDHGPMVYAGLNALQHTAWRVNTGVLQMMNKVWKQGGGEAGIPTAEDLVIPERFTDEDDSDAEWRASAERFYRHNARLVGKRLAFLQTMTVAHEFRDRTFYFPYNCDFRGRIYPIPQFLQPQGNDVARGLLMFDEAEPLGQRGLWWLRVQYANCHGVDKVSFGERVAWTDEVLHHVVEQCCTGVDWGIDLLQHSELWANADDPWQALATLQEIMQAYASGDPTTYECRLPVNVDGSNSGLQHFSAMMRDPVGAKLVNLTPAEQPHDIYSDVAVCVDRMVREDQAAPDQDHLPDTTLGDLPGQWLEQGINRKLCKRGTMTYCYGVTQQGLQDALVSDGFVDWAEHQYAATQYIGKKIWAGIQACITGATEVMDYLRTCASCANKAGVLLDWFAPSGFHVQHPYLEPQVRRVQTLSGEIRFKVYDPDARVSTHKQRNSLPPNFVHALDAAHLIMTVAAAVVNGIRSFMMIHDSFGTHAGKVDLLQDVLREQFVRLYSIDVLAAFRQRVIEQTGHDPGPPPERGDFDLESVHDSEYIFS